MDEQNQVDWFQDIETIVVTPLSFKAKLAIGEDAYTALKVKNTAIQVWDVAGVATTAALVAKSSAVASVFFAPTGFLAAIGLGTAVTPIGWVIAASVVTGGAWVGITRHLKKASAQRVTVIPNFISTPLDVLALALFDLLAPLALKMAERDGHIEAGKRRAIHHYFVSEWGYDERFVDAGIGYIESRLDSLSLKTQAQTLADFSVENPDCNFKLMSREILAFLRNIAAPDGQLAAGDVQAIAHIEQVFHSATRYSLRKRIARSLSISRKALEKVFTRNKS